MADKKVRVENPNKYTVIVGLSNGVVREVKPKSFVLLPIDEVDYLAATTSFFTDKHLIIADKGVPNKEVIEEVGLDPEEVHYLTDEELEKKLKGGKISDFQKFIDGYVGNIPQSARIREMAAKLDLRASRMDYIAEKLG